MYRAPVFYHKLDGCSFILVRTKKKSEDQYYLRSLECTYTVGQQEPKIEVLNPHSREMTNFTRKRIQAYTKIIMEGSKNLVSWYDLVSLFSEVTEQVLKKIVREIGVEEDRNHYCVLTQPFSEEDNVTYSITPENVCQYEGALFGLHNLRSIGIEVLTSTDKISYATMKFLTDENTLQTGDSKTSQEIGRMIEEELLCTPWNLSQSFINCIKTKGLLALKGVGDPSNGLGGFSFLKLPLKMSTNESGKKVLPSLLELQKYKNMQNNRSVTGTDADLRKLSKSILKLKLVELGMREEDIDNLSRWQCVDKLRLKASEAASKGSAGECQKYARGCRVTTKIQKKFHQREVNKIFNRQVSILSDEKLTYNVRAPQSAPPIPKVKKEDPKLTKKEEVDEKEDEKDRSNLLDAIKNQTIDKFLLEDLKDQSKPKQIEFMKEVIVNHVKDLQGMYIYFDDVKREFKVLKKYKRWENEDGELEEKTVFISDPKQIKCFEKRKDKHHNFYNDRKPNQNKKKAINPMNNIASANTNLIRIENITTNIQIPHEELPSPSTTKIKLDLGGLNLSTSTGGFVYSEAQGLRRAGSKKRQNSIESSFNDMLESIIHECFIKDKQKFFVIPVSKRIAPDYTIKIKKPMDLGTMRDRCKRIEYVNIKDFMADLELIAINAELYNGSLHFITDLAKGIRDYGMSLIERQRKTLDEYEKIISDSKQVGISIQL